VTEIDSHLAASLSPRFRLIRQLGAGGMGAVFLAEQIAVGNRPVALKVLLRKLLDDPEFLQRFQNEAASTGRIRHPNVVTIHESGQADDGSPYIAMEYLEGETLRNAIKTRGAMPVSECAGILQQVARGLNAAHKLGILHRDLKPDNIFLANTDDGEVVVKVMDFGLAKLRESTTHTLTGTILGTPAYMSPEQALGMKSEDLDARSDLYALGVMVYEMLTGRVPFHSDTPIGYLHKHIMETPPPLGVISPGLHWPLLLESVVMRALAKKREERYATVLEFSKEFGEAAARSPEAGAHLSQAGTIRVEYAPTPEPSRGTGPGAARPSSPGAPGVAAGKPDTAVETPTTPVRPVTPPPITPASQPPTGSGGAVAAPLYAQEAVRWAEKKVSDKPKEAGPPVREAPKPPPAPTPAPTVREESAGMGAVGQTTPAPAPAPGPAVREAPAVRSAPAAPPRTAPAPVRFTVPPEPPSRIKYYIGGTLLLAVAVAGGVWLYMRSQTAAVPAAPPAAGASKTATAGEGQILPAGMVAIPAGTFVMGRDDGTDPEETPAHSVSVSAFYIDKTPVTNAKYAGFVRHTSHGAPPSWVNGAYAAGQGEWPVTGVSWNDAQAYCQAGDERLPSEAEWEYAARGAEDRLYPWGNEFSSDLVNSRGAGHNSAEPVGAHPGDASPFGVLDMSGNVWQWVADDYKPYPGRQPAFQIPADAKVIRGGSFHSDREHVTTTARNLDHASARSREIGFRCAKSQ